MIKEMNMVFASKMLSKVVEFGFLRKEEDGWINFVCYSQYSPRGNNLVRFERALKDYMCQKFECFCIQNLKDERMYFCEVVSKLFSIDYIKSNLSFFKKFSVSGKAIFAYNLSKKASCECLLCSLVDIYGDLI